MKSSELKRGRIFVITLDTGESIKNEIEKFCRENKILRAKVNILGGILPDSSYVSGPIVDKEKNSPIVPFEVSTDNPTEFHGIGTVFPNQKGEPILHLHGSLGREGNSSTGCFREKAFAWLTLEVILEELIGEGSERVYDETTRVSPLVLK